MRQWIFQGWIPMNPGTWNASLEGTAVGAAQFEQYDDADDV